ncbi:MAG TPA: hypothetical protein VES67_12875 [Vicinamibacterales bacterium]|nr:hypothetical protein [Vicinamibacterales bacterium]
MDPVLSASPRLWPRLVPGVVFLAYLVGTVLLFYFGPWIYPIAEGKGRLLAFLIAVHVAFAAGYLLGLRGQPRGSRFDLDINRWVLCCAAVDLLLLFPTSRLNTGAWIPNPFAALTDLGDAYTRSLTLRDLGTPYVNYLRIIVSPLLSAALPLGVFFWPSLTALTRAVLAASIVGTLALFVAMGANAGVAHWAAMFPWFVVANWLSGARRLNRRTWIAVGAIQLVAVVCFGAFFAATMLQRKGGYVQSGQIPSISAHTRSVGPALPNLVAPPRSPVRVSVEGLASYLTQGYYAVYLSLQEPFIPSYGAGHSMFLLRQLVRVTGDASLLDRPYPKRIERRGWNAYGHWATIYPWIASDVTFPGTVVIVLLIGVLLARVWIDVIGARNPFAVAFLGQMLLMLYYFPAHNKAMQSGEGVVAFWVLLAAWTVSRRKMRGAGGD